RSKALRPRQKPRVAGEPPVEIMALEPYQRLRPARHHGERLTAAFDFGDCQQRRGGDAEALCCGGDLAPGFLREHWGIALLLRPVSFGPPGRGQVAVSWRQERAAPLRVTLW